MIPKTLLLIIFQFFYSQSVKAYDLTVVGPLRFSNSIGRLAVGVIDCLKDDLTINFINTRPLFSRYHDIPQEIQKIARSSDSAIAGNVALLTDHIWLPHLGDIYKKMPDSTIKIAYTMVESTRIPSPWVSILNEHFDLAVVPNEWLVEIYKKSGVTIPLFVLPCIVYLEEFLALPQKIIPHKPFTFGISSNLEDRKNIKMLIKSFIREFRNDLEVKLFIHLARGNQHEANTLKARVKNKKNISIHTGFFSWPGYVKFFSSLDCYVLLSKGEGFSITPLEALSSGIPCVLSNNTAHKIYCMQPSVRSVPSRILNDAQQGVYGKNNTGKNFQCYSHEARKALRDIYKHYATYLARAQSNREWAKRYTKDGLRNHYLTLIKPKNVILGTQNKIHEQTLETDSLNLFNKYQKIL